MSLISTLLFTISANLDNIPIGIFFAINNNKLKIFDLIEISFFTSIFTFIIMLIGNIIAKILPIEFSNQIAAYIIIIIGLYGIIKEICNKKRTKKIRQQKNNNYLSKYKTIILLSMNNLVLGINASITGISYLSSSIFTFIFSFIFLYIGYFIGKKINFNLISNISNYLSYIIILILGIVELI